MPYGGRSPRGIRDKSQGSRLQLGLLIGNGWELFGDWDRGLQVPSKPDHLFCGNSGHLEPTAHAGTLAVGLKQRGAAIMSSPTALPVADLGVHKDALTSPDSLCPKADDLLIT
jgi:hypothetical protein